MPKNIATRCTRSPYIHSLSTGPLCSHSPYRSVSTQRALFTRLFLCIAIGLSSPAISQTTPQEPPAQNTDTDTDTEADAVKNKPEGEIDESQKEATETAPAVLGPGQQYRYDPLQQQSLIEAELLSTHQQTESIWLTANEANFLALWSKDKSGDPQGAVLILPSENTNPANKHTLNNIQSYLSKNGWSTLTLSMPKQLKKSPPDRPAEIKIEPTIPNNTDTAVTDTATENTDDVDPEESTVDESQVVYDDSAEDQSEGKTINTSETTNADVDAAPSPPPPPTPVEPVEPEALARIAAGIQYLQDNKQLNNIVLADGISAARIIRAMYSEEAKTDAAAFQSVRGLILLNSLQKLEETPEFNFLNAFEKITVPTFDIIESASGRIDVDIAMQNLAHRKNQARASNIPVYLSRKIQPTPLGSHGELRLTRIIRGFLYQHAQGMESKPN